MKRFRLELVLALALAAAVAFIWHAQEPNRPLTVVETERYLTIIDQQFPFPSRADKAEALTRLRSFAVHDDGRDVYMLNLLRFYDALESGPAIPADYQGTPAEANEYYESKVLPIILRSGSFPIFAGTVDEPNVMGSAVGEDNWSRVLVVHYPSRRHFFDLLTNPNYLKIAAYKSYAMHVGLVPVKREMVVPDFRSLAAVSAIVIFLFVAWLRALWCRKA